MDPFDVVSLVIIAAWIIEFWRDGSDIGESLATGRVQDWARKVLHPSPWSIALFVASIVFLVVAKVLGRA